MRLLLPILLMLMAPALRADPLDQPRAAWQSGDLATALSGATARLREDPADAGARLLRGRIELARGEPELAELAIRRAAELGAPRADWLIPLADALLRQGRFQHLLEQVKPADGDSHALLSEIARANAEALHGLGRYETAELTMTQARRFDPSNGRIDIARAGWAIAAGRLDKARALLEQAVERDPELAMAWEMLGSLAHRGGDLKAAEAAYGKAVSSPSGWLVHHKRALLRIGIGDLEGAAADLEAVAAVRPGFAGLAYARGRLALAQGRPQQALVALEVYLRARPRDHEARYYAAVAAIAQNRLAEAEELLARVVRAMPRLPQPTLLLARLRLERGNPQGAESLLRPFVGKGPADLDRTLVQALLAQGRIEEADSLLLDRARSGDTQLALIAAARLLRSGESDRAAELLRPLVNAHPADGDARLLLIRSLAAAGENGSALAEARALAEAAPGDARALNALGVVLAMTGDTVAARTAFRQGIAAGGPGSVAAALGLARAESATGNPKAAYEVLVSALEANPGNGRLLAALSVLDQRRGDPEAALRHLRDGLSEHPADLALRLTLVRRLLRDRQPEQALAVLDAAPANQGDRPGVLRLRGIAALALVETGEIDEAKRLLMTLNDRHFAERAEARALLQRIAR